MGATATLPLPFGRVDLGSQLMLRLFGETSDSSASFAAAQGDRTSESPLRDLALQVIPTASKAGFAQSESKGFGQDRLALTDLSPTQAASSFEASPFDAGSSSAQFAAPSPPSDGLAAPDVHFTAAYRPVPPMPTISPAPGTLAFVAPDVHPADFLPATTQIGSVRVEGSAEGSPVTTPQLDSTSGSYGAGANFDVRAGKRSLNVDLSSEYQHVGDSDTGSLALSPPGSASGLQLPGSAVPLTLPNGGDVNKLSLGAGVSVPVVRGLTLNLNYDAQRLYGGYGLPGLLNLETVNNTYGGKLTFNIPQISSSLSVGAYQDRFQDGSILPVNGTTDTREDVNFTVKF